MSAEKIIVALDCGASQAETIAKALQGQASWLKVGMTLYYSAGPAIVSRFKEMGFKVFVDLKLHDIPHQVSGAAAALVEAGADMLTMHCSGGKEMLAAGEASVREAAARLRAPKPCTLGITVLTSLDDADLAAIGVAAASPAEQVMRLAALAQAAGLSGVVASPKEAAALRSALGADCAIVTPGVRMADGSMADQKRAATPAQAFADGASHIVVGRPVTEAADPQAAFAAIAATLL